MKLRLVEPGLFQPLSNLSSWSSELWQEESKNDVNTCFSTSTSMPTHWSTTSSLLCKPIAKARAESGGILLRQRMFQFSPALVQESEASSPMEANLCSSCNISWQQIASREHHGVMTNSQTTLQRHHGNFQWKSIWKSIQTYLLALGRTYITERQHEHPYVADIHIVSVICRIIFVSTQLDVSLAKLS